ncbi:MAG: hypothetical protein JXR61_08035 [Prolixibacteraceae bacterium]|nr:hypothetical protein [Prolixibacteraceae bacterium]
MSQNVNSRENLVRQTGPVWKIKVAVYAPGKLEKKGSIKGIKRWKIKEILN